MQRLTALGLALLLGPIACGGDDNDDPDAGPLADKPQIFPNLSPVCLTPGWIPEYVKAGGVPKAQPLALLNRGAETLSISSVDFFNTSADVWSVSGVSPMNVEFNDQALTQLVFTPVDPGWYYGTFRVRSNAENFPNLQIFVLGLAVPNNLDAGSESQWDAGPKPDAAYGPMDGNIVEICAPPGGS